MKLAKAVSCLYILSQVQSLQVSMNSNDVHMGGKKLAFHMQNRGVKRPSAGQSNKLPMAVPAIGTMVLGFPELANAATKKIVEAVPDDLVARATQAVSDEAIVAAASNAVQQQSEVNTAALYFFLAALIGASAYRMNQLVESGDVDPDYFKVDFDVDEFTSYFKQDDLLGETSKESTPTAAEKDTAVTSLSLEEESSISSSYPDLPVLLERLRANIDAPLAVQQTLVEDVMKDLQGIQNLASEVDEIEKMLADEKAPAAYLRQQLIDDALASSLKVESVEIQAPKKEKKRVRFRRAIRSWIPMRSSA